MSVISIVGNAESIIGSRCGELIDSADIVVRCNYGIPTEENKKDIGSRTDFVFFAGGWARHNKQTQEEVRKQYGDPIAITLDANTASKNYEKFIRYPMDLFWRYNQKVYNQKKGHPHLSTGLASIVYFIDGNEINIYGFDFFDTNDWSRPTIYGKRDCPAHDFWIEEQYVKKLKTVKIKTKPTVALLCSGSRLPNRLFKEDIIVRVNKTVPQTDSRCDIWFFGDGYDYRPYKAIMKAKRVIGYSACSDIGWFEQYPSEYFKRLKRELKGYQPCIGTMALYWLIKNGYSVNVYGMDFMRTGYFDGRQAIKERICEPHNFDIEEDFVVNKLKGDFKMVNS